MYKKVFTLLLLLLPFQLLIAQKSLLKNFPEGYTPDEIGRRISYRFVTEKHALHAGKWIGYPETFYWNGSLKYAAAAKDRHLSSFCKPGLSICLLLKRLCCLSRIM